MLASHPKINNRFHVTKTTRANPMQTYHRLTLAIVIATVILGVNAYAVINGWSPFRVPGS